MNGSSLQLHKGNGTTSRINLNNTSAIKSKNAGTADYATNSGTATYANLADKTDRFNWSSTMIGKQIGFSDGEMMICKAKPYGSSTVPPFGIYIKNGSTVNKVAGNNQSSYFNFNSATPSYLESDMIRISANGSEYIKYIVLG